MVIFPAEGAGIINNAIEVHARTNISLFSQRVLYLMIAGEEMMEAQQVMDGLYE
jgi:hypothetical protein